MALTTCVECAGRLSTKALLCPHCGFSNIIGDPRHLMGLMVQLATPRSVQPVKMTGSRPLGSHSRAKPMASHAATLHMKVEPGLYARIGKRRTSYSTMVNGKRIPLGHDLAVAQAKLAAMRGDDKPAIVRTIEAMCAGYIAEQRALLEAGDATGITELTINQYEGMLKRRVIPYCGAMAPRDFTPAHKAQYLAARRKGNPENGIKPAPIGANREMAALGSAFHFGMVEGLVSANPCLGVRRNSGRPRTRNPSVTELNSFLAFSKGQGKGKYMVALIGALVGIMGRRRAEFIRLTDASMTAEGLKCKDSKTKAGEPERFYTVQWSDLLRQILTEARGIRSKVKSIYLFPTRTGAPYTDDGYSSNWNKLMRAWEAQGGARFRAHDLRALYIGCMTHRGEDPNTHRNKETQARVYDRRTDIKVKPLA
ncbi:MAG: hypothetical protein EOO15_03960 [Chitinophagaceae bacterium]|nr:MAG: hypothetical protein EOO15_03960 [Chitinophagaceae bacterium]